MLYFCIIFTVYKLYLWDISATQSLLFFTHLRTLIPDSHFIITIILSSDSSSRSSYDVNIIIIIIIIIKQVFNK